MNIGYLDRRIEFIAPATNFNDYGEVTSDGAAVYKVWAAMDNKSANGAVVLEQETAVNRVVWRVRSSSNMRAITPKFQIRYDSDLYRILAIQEVGRKNELHFVTEKTSSD